MAISLSHFPISFALLLSLITSIVGAATTSYTPKTVTYDFNITWVTSNPDGAYERTTIGINNQWPLPIITATKGDQIIVNVNNQLGNQTTTLHFHGLFMNGTADMDGPNQVSQCAIQPGTSFTYNFTVSIIYSQRNKSLIQSRLLNPVLTGIILMTRDNIQMASELL
jgi:iron transport multicopper oxidase